VATPGYGRRYAAAIPAARLVPIEGAGHVPTREKPEEVHATIDAFLAETGH
jgi:pimeloyl-ACP methyl ester carboxylesterase